MLNGESVIREKTDEHAAGGIDRGRHAQLEKDAGPFSTDGSRSRRGNWRRYFCAFRFGRALRGPGTDAVVRLIRNGMRVRGAVRRGVCGDDSAGWERLHLRVCDAGRIDRVDHRVGSDAGIRDGRQYGFVGLVEPLHRAVEYVSPANAAVVGLRSLDGAVDSRKRSGATARHKLGFDAGAWDASVSG